MVHVLLSTERPVPAGQTPVVALPPHPTLGDLHHLSEVCPVVRLVDYPPHLPPGVPLVPGRGQLGDSLADPLSSVLAVAGGLAGEEGDAHHGGVEHSRKDGGLTYLCQHVLRVILRPLLSKHVYIGRHMYINKHVYISWRVRAVQNLNILYFTFLYFPLAKREFPRRI